MDKKEAYEGQKPTNSNSKAKKSGSDPTDSKGNQKISSKFSKSNMIVNNFVLVKEIGKGAFGEIYLTYDKRGNKQVATKKEMKTIDTDNKLRTEALIYQKLLNIKKQDVSGENLIIQDSVLGVPGFYGAGETPEFNYLIIDFLGPNLLDLLKLCRRKKFTLSTTSLLGLQIINRIEYFHNHDYVHRDIKPENFVIGTQDKSNIIYLIDYGLSKRYRSGKNNQHIPYKEDKSLIGTARYVSINTHFGIEQSRRDDLESIGYILIFFLKGSLPWQGLKGNERFQSILEKKLQIPPELLCQGLPEEMTSYFNYCKSLRFEDHPDYDYLRGLFILILGKCVSVYGISKQNMKFDWCYKDQEEIWQMFSRSNRKTTLKGFNEQKSYSSSQIDTPQSSNNNSHAQSQKFITKKSWKEKDKEAKPKDLMHLSTIKEKVGTISQKGQPTFRKENSTLSNMQDERIIILTHSPRDNQEDDKTNESEKTQKCSFHGDAIKVKLEAQCTQEEDRISNYISKILIKGSTKSNSSSRDYSDIEKKYSLKDCKVNKLCENEGQECFERPKTYYKAQTPNHAPRKTGNKIENQLSRIKTIRGGSNCYLHSKLRPNINKLIWDHYTNKPIENDALISSNMTRLLISKQDMKYYSLFTYPKDTINSYLAKSVECCGLTTITDMIEDVRYFHFISEETGYDNIMRHFVSMQSFNELQVKAVFKNLLKVLNNIHLKKSFFKELHYKDIIVCEKDQVKIANYQLCDTPFSKQTSNESDLVLFTSPEKFERETEILIDNTNDIWKCGVILYLLLSGNIPFNGDKDAILSQSLEFPYEKWKNISAEAIDLLKHMLRKKQSKRYTISQCLKHPWIADSRTEQEPCNIFSTQLEIAYYTICLANAVKDYLTEKESLQSDLSKLSEIEIIDNEEKDFKQIVQDYYGDNDIKALPKQEDLISIENLISIKQKAAKSKFAHQLKQISRRSELTIQTDQLIRQLDSIDCSSVVSIIEQIQLESVNHLIAIGQCVKSIELKI